jgi:hypothetical protein
MEREAKDLTLPLDCYEFYLWSIGEIILPPSVVLEAEIFFNGISKKEQK